MIRGINMRKKKKIKIKLKYYFYILFFIISFVCSIKFLHQLNYSISNETYLKMLIENSNSFINFSDSSKKDLSYYLVSAALNINFKTNLSDLKKKYTSFTTVSASDDENIGAVNSDYINDPYPDKNVINPIVYIYNTHQLEEYSSSSSEYGIVPNVMMTSYILREKLYSNGINAIVETNNVEDILNINNWNYASSYKVTRLFMDDAATKNKTLKYFVDIHRDSVSKNISTVSIDGKSFAKVLFIVGLENPNYAKNLALTEKINSMISGNYPSISRGIMKKEGAGVNGIYNQDFSENAILIEVGGHENKIDEVLNTTIAISDVLSNYIHDNDSIGDDTK